MSEVSAKRRKLSTENGAQHATRKGVKGTENRSRSDVPTAELAAASGMFKSNVFKLQVDELLSQLRPDHDKLLSRVEKPLRKLKSIIERIINIPPKPVYEAERELRKRSGIAVPFPDPRPAKDTKYTLQYTSPVNINVVGSFVIKTEVKSKLTTIDLAVTIPSSLFQRKDYLNYRYFHKRAYYIACIAAGIKDAGEPDFKISWIYQDGNTLRPVILLEPTENADESFIRSKSCIRILTSIEDAVFPTHLTLPTSNNIRKGNADQDQQSNSSQAAVDHTPTSIYNATLRSEASVSAFLKLQYAASLKCAAFRDACILGRIWLQQRGFGTSFAQGGFGHFEWATLLALLLEGGGPNGKPLLSPSYSSYQVFKATIQFLSGKNLVQPFMLQAGDVSKIPASDVPVFFDGKRGLNILYKMSSWSYALLRHESFTTLKMLNDSLCDNFNGIFIWKVDDPLCRFDHLISVSPQTALSSTLHIVKYQSSIYQVLSKALGNRAKLINLFVRDTPAWPIDSGSLPSAKEDSSSVTIALLLDAEHSNRIVDHGPSAEDKEASISFRRFWGDKSELRRFKDGSIMESLVWSDRASDPPIVQQIVSHILKLHFGLEESRIALANYGLNADYFNGASALNPTAPFQQYMDAFDSLEKLLKGMDGLPLTLHQLSAASSLLRYTSTQVSSNGLTQHNPADIILQFEGSTRWPDDLTAIQMTKLAFLLKIAELLEESKEVASCQIGIENESRKFLNTSFLDIALPSSIIFRLRIYHDREQTLLEQQLKRKDIAGRQKEDLAFALATHRRNFIQAPRHTQTIRTLSTRFPLLSPTIRLVKKWANSHLLTPYLREELLELIVCRVFVHPYPWNPPSSILTGFLRTLHFLSRWDWKLEPLIVDLNQELTPQQLSEIQKRFDAWRNIDPMMNTVALFVASNLDPDGISWTQFSKPPQVVAARLSALAKSAMKLVTEKRLDLKAPELFRSPLADYDFVLRLHPKYVSGSHNKKKNQIVFKNVQGLGHGGFGYDMTGFKPAAVFVDELSHLFGHAIMLFHGDDEESGGGVIAGVWNQQTTKPRPWGLKIRYSIVPSNVEGSDEDGTELIPNKSAILNEIAALGGELVKKIQVNR
ncbi:U3 small nucleolar RNA-associated protein [Paracoccidioides lutzii Pb01]|uniref:U3 small nucleolar RNA-associated protein 22 n=1 Tax=Paracoccidioides lutzii (strain ATCC MYA-826 / Pb01) TaxID=502779 RepID=C1HDT4_PARBA|nr:U3 small nucleolar RNA-associated protein [Paracoccidioides lutzii Pb01]EEH40078.1 U3 small nucleolar RNA-associated protein [Paracoccidioides lutzii Pb01]